MMKPKAVKPLGALKIPRPKKGTRRGNKFKGVQGYAKGGTVRGMGAATKGGSFSGCH